MLVVLTAAILTTLLIPIYGSLSDRVGRKKLYMMGAFGMIAFAFPYFLIINQGNVAALLIGTIIGLSVIWSPITAVLGTMFSEVFSKEVRYTGVTLGYQLGAALAGGTAPLIATYLMEQFKGSWIPVAVYIIVVAIISIASVATIKENKQSDTTNH